MLEISPEWSEDERRRRLRPELDMDFANIGAADALNLIFLAWGVALLWRVLRDGGAGELEKGMPVVDVPVAFVARWLKKSRSNH